jgi:hypothetical protein
MDFNGRSINQEGKTGRIDKITRDIDPIETRASSRALTAKDLFAGDLTQQSKPHALRTQGRRNYDAKLRRSRKKTGLSPVAIAAAATATTAAPASRTFFAGARLVNGQGAALEIFLVEHVNGLGGVLLGRHFDEREAPGTPRGSVLHNVDCNDHARLGKMILQIVFGCCER